MAQDISKTVLVATVWIIAFTTLAVFTRLWIRASRHDWGLDDYMVLFSWAFLASLTALILATRTAGLGRHRDDVSDADFERFVIYNIALSACYSWSIATAKMSFAVLYIRLLPKALLININKAMVIFLACQTLEESLITILQCRPVHSAWKVGVEGTCLDLRILWWSTFIFNLITDLTLFIQPIPTIWHLQMPKGKRMGLIFMLSLGLLVCIISVVRIVQSTRLKGDVTYELAEQAIWSQSEVATLLICSCVPISRQLVQKIPGLRYAFGNSSDKSSKPHFHAGGANNPGLPLSDYKKSNQTKNQSSFSHHSHAYTSGQIGITTEVIVERADSDSTEEIFPNRDSKRDRAMGRDLSGSIEDESPMSTSWRMDSVENTVRVEAKEHGAL